MGALDVCPFVPVSGIDMDACVVLARNVGAAHRARARRARLPVRSRRLEARDGRAWPISARAGTRPFPPSSPTAEWAPDFGPAAFVPRWGASAVGARKFLIAYNVNLNTRDRRLAGEIALRIRESGRAARDARRQSVVDAEGKTVKIPGRLRGVSAIGWYIDAYRCAQVSINLLDYETTPLHVVFEAVKDEAEKLGLLVTGGEIVGLVPLAPLVEAGRHFLGDMGKSEVAGEAELVETAIRSMGLDSVSPFEPSHKIVEYAGKMRWNEMQQRYHVVCGMERGFEP